MKKSKPKKSESIPLLVFGALFLIYVIISFTSSAGTITPLADDSARDDGLCIDAKTGLIRLPETGEKRVIKSTKQIISSDGKESYLVHTYQCLPQ
ncbi:MAG: hypothetical protein FJY91_03025 [Candidatus Harrisonbacteria bacterium]|nr:hypothetical protein [Candidatus Harrisonbacteria bacterium]